MTAALLMERGVNELFKNFPLKKHIPLSVRSSVARGLFRYFFVYERDIVDFYKQHAPYKTAIDIGAACGYHTRRLARLSQKVIAIEPINELKNMPSNVEIRKVAVGRIEGVETMSILHSFSDFTNAKFGGSGTLGSIQVKVVPLNSIVTKADFLKIDTEGHEIEILEEAEVMKSLKYLAIEIHGDVANVTQYQKRIFEIIKDFDVFMPNLGRYVTEDDIPIHPAFGHLLCVRRSIGLGHAKKGDEE